MNRRLNLQQGSFSHIIWTAWKGVWWHLFTVCFDALTYMCAFPHCLSPGYLVGKWPKMIHQTKKSEEVGNLAHTGMGWVLWKGAKRSFGCTLTRVKTQSIDAAFGCSTVLSSDPSQCPHEGHRLWIPGGTGLGHRQWFKQDRGLVRWFGLRPNLTGFDEVVYILCQGGPPKVVGQCETIGLPSTEDRLEWIIQEGKVLFVRHVKTWLSDGALETMTGRIVLQISATVPAAEK